MDLMFDTMNGKFNYRVCALILKDKRCLITRKVGQPYYYLPGGRVKLFETAETALKREIKEELSVECGMIRPLWFVQSFFYESIHAEKFHEICIYYLVSIENNNSIFAQDSFIKSEGNFKYEYRWCMLDEMKEYSIYPEFIKDSINSLPQTLEIINYNTITNSIK